MTAGMSLYMKSSRTAAQSLCCDMALKSPDGKGPEKRSHIAEGAPWSRRLSGVPADTR